MHRDNTYRALVALQRQNNDKRVFVTVIEYRRHNRRANVRVAYYGVGYKVVTNTVFNHADAIQRVNVATDGLTHSAGRHRALPRVASRSISHASTRSIPWTSCRCTHTAIRSID